MQAHEPPPPVRMVELLGGFRISQALYAAAALGVADQLVAGPAPMEALAGHTGARSVALAAVARKPPEDAASAVIVLPPSAYRDGSPWGTRIRRWAAGPATRTRAGCCLVPRSPGDKHDCRLARQSQLGSTSQVTRESAIAPRPAPDFAVTAPGIPHRSSTAGRTSPSGAMRSLPRRECGRHNPLAARTGRRPRRWRVRR